jgi:hypothetical protein
MIGAEAFLALRARQASSPAGRRARGPWFVTKVVDPKGLEARPISLARFPARPHKGSPMFDRMRRYGAMSQNNCVYRLDQVICIGAEGPLDIRNLLRYRRALVGILAK